MEEIKTDQKVTTGKVLARYMSFNIKCITKDELPESENSWEKRKESVAKIIASSGCDFVGIQESHREQTKYLSSTLKSVGLKKSNTSWSTNKIYYQTAKWKLLEDGMFGLSDTPDVKAITYGNAVARSCTWSIFEHLESGKKIVVYDTHLDHKVFEANTKMVLQIKDFMKKQHGSYENILLGGDMNEKPGSKNIELLKVSDEILLEDTFIKENYPKNDRTFTGFDNKAKRRIDYIFMREGMKVSNFTILQQKEPFPSDHFPIIAEVFLK